MERYEIRNGLETIRKEMDGYAGSLQISAKRRETARLTSLTMQDDFWDDQNKARAVLDELNGMKKIVDEYDAILNQLTDLEATLTLWQESDDAELGELLELEYPEFQAAFDKFSEATLFSGPYDHYNAIVEIHPGAGGTESMDWASMLFRMYTHFAEKNGFQVEVLDVLDGEEAGLKSVSFLMRGDMAFGHLRSERGVHRLVRISPFDANKRRHTSFASVDVMPEFHDDTVIEIKPEDLRVDTYRSSGAGGQHINKTDSAIRITHLPTGIVVSCQTQRSQMQNRDQAMNMLRSKLMQRALDEKAEKLAAIRGEHKEIGWGSQIRSYVFHPYSMVKDLRTGYETANTQAVMDGDLNGFIRAYLKWAEPEQIS